MGRLFLEKSSGGFSDEEMSLCPIGIPEFVEARLCNQNPCPSRRDV